jgi:C4-dicarboxylate transporter DctM subunit
LVATAGGIAMLIPPSIILLVYGIVTETSIVALFFAGVIPGLLLALGNALSVILIALIIKLPRGTFEARRCWVEFKGAAPALGMPIVILGGLYGGLFTPTEAAAAACGYALLYGVLSGRMQFMRQILPTAQRSLNLTAVVVFLIGSVGVFQFLAANMYWPQAIAKTVTSWGLTPIGFIFAYMFVLIILGMFVDGVAMVILTVPVVFPIAMALKIDPVHLAIMVTLNVEMGVVTPPVGLNLFAVSGTSKFLQVLRHHPLLPRRPERAARDLLPGDRHLAARQAGDRRLREIAARRLSAARTRNSPPCRRRRRDSAGMPGSGTSAGWRPPGRAAATRALPAPGRRARCLFPPSR